jgi:hypothetical protein
MDVQEIVTLAIVGIAVFLTARTFIGQFTSTEGSCPKCPQCGPVQNEPDHSPAQLIQIEEDPNRA